MFALYINQKPAVLKSGTSIKLTRENPYFTAAGDYTLDVTLPLAGCKRNLDIFGLIHLKQSALVPLADAKFPFSLIAGGLQLAGTAVVTNVTETEAKVQLLAGNSDFRFRGKDLYIDEMDLGRAWDVFPDFTWYQRILGDYEEEQTCHSGDIDDIVIFLEYATDHVAAGAPTVPQFAFGTFDETNALAFPIYSTDTETVANPWIMPDTYGRYHVSMDNNIEQPIIAPQPYLLHIVSRTFAAAGYPNMDLSTYATNRLARGLFIANSRAGRTELAATLPHWTFEEFVTELQNFLGCVFLIDGQGRAAMRSRAAFYSGAEFVELKEVTDELNTDIDNEGENNNSSAGNVAYDFDTIPDTLRLPDEVWQNARIEHYADDNAVRQAYNALLPAEKAKSTTLYMSDRTGNIFASLHNLTDETQYYLARIDQAGPLIRRADTRDIDTTLRIVPAQICLSGFSINNKDADYFIFEGTYPLPVTPEAPGTLLPAQSWEQSIPTLQTDDTTLTLQNTYSIDRAIQDATEAEEESTTTERKDRIEVAWYGGVRYSRLNLSHYEQMASGAWVDLEVKPPFDGGIPLPVALPLAQKDCGEWAEPYRLLTTGIAFGQDGPFSLKEKSTPFAVGSLISGAAAIDARVLHKFTFTDRAAPLDPTRPYLIAGRLYACARLELTIDEHGLAPLKTGYFYEIS